MQPWFHSITVPDAQIDILAGEVDVMQGGADPQVNVGMRVCKATKPVHEPFGREIRRRTDGQRARTLALQKPLCA